MIADPATLYKLIILYILDHSEFPLTNSQLCEFLLDKGYTTYFTIQACHFGFGWMPSLFLSHRKITAPTTV